MACISVSKMLLEWTFPKRKFSFGKYLMDYQKRKLYARNFGKILKNTEKIPTGLEIAKNSEIFLMTPNGETQGAGGGGLYKQ